jgi:sigma-B regulation protein RsbU (phosphoserine phosphatase)
MSLVPSVALSIGPWEVHGKVAPAHDVGRDYYDYFPLGDGRFGITIAQVSGRGGLSAALTMSNVRALLRAFCNGDREITEAIRQVNRCVPTTAAKKWVALVFGEVDHERGVLRFTNAGHNFPMLYRRDGSIEELTEGGLPLGVIDDAEYERGEVAFAPGDHLLLYSASIYKANDSAFNMFGADRLRTLWQSYCTLRSGEIIDCLIRDVEKFRGSAVQIHAEGDSMTAVVVGPRSDR